MRLDDYLSTVFLIKRRTLAKEWIEAKRVHLNQRAIKPAHEVRVGDHIDIRYPRSTLRLEVTELPGKSVAKSAATRFYRVLEQIGPSVEDHAPEGF